MPGLGGGLGGYVNRRLPEWMRDPNDIWNRRRGGIASQHDRKLMSQGRAGRDPKVSQWDYLYGGANRPGKDIGSLHSWGYNPSPGTRFDPAGGTLGGMRQVLGTRPLTGEWWNDPALGGANPMSGGLDRYRYDIARDLFQRPNLSGRAGGAVSADTGRGKRESPGSSTGARFPDGGTSGVGTSTPPTGGSSSRQNFQPFYRDNQPTFGTPITPMAQAIQLAMEEAALGNFGQLRALTNLGIYGPGGMQTILEQAEGPENQMLADLPGRTNELIGQNTMRGADARRQMLKGLSPGRAGAQRPGMAGQMVAQATIPQRIEESRYAGDITEAGYNMADQISLGQGERRSALSKENMQSKLHGLQGMGAATGQAGGMLGDRYWETESPLNDLYTFQSGMMGEQSQYDRQAALLGGQINRRNIAWGMQNQSYYNQLDMKYRAMLQQALAEYEDDGGWFGEYINYVFGNARMLATMAGGG